MIFVSILPFNPLAMKDPPLVVDVLGAMGLLLVHLEGAVLNVTRNVLLDQGIRRDHVKEYTTQSVFLLN